MVSCGALVFWAPNHWVRSPCNVAFFAEVFVLPLDELLVSRKHCGELTTPVNTEPYALRSFAPFVGVILRHVERVDEFFQFLLRNTVDFTEHFDEGFVAPCHPLACPQKRLTRPMPTPRPEHIVSLHTF